MPGGKRAYLSESSSDDSDGSGTAVEARLVIDEEEAPSPPATPPPQEPHWRVTVREVFGSDVSDDEDLDQDVTEGAAKGGGDGRKKEEPDYEVEEIIKKHWNQKQGRFEWMVKWKGYDDYENSWEPKENLKGCNALLEKFEQQQLRKHRAPPKRRAEKRPCRRPDYYYEEEDSDDDEVKEEEDEEEEPKELEDNDIFDSEIPIEERPKLWEVEAIVGKMYSHELKKILWRVKWKGSNEKSWEPAANLRKCWHMVKAFEKKRKQKQKHNNPSTSRGFIESGEDDWSDFSDDEAKKGQPKFTLHTQAYYNKDYTSRFRRK